MSSKQDDIRFWRDADLGGLELRYSCYDQACFDDHTHDAYSIGIIQGGTTRAKLRGKSVSPHAGQVVLIPPGEVHSCNPVEGSSWAYRMFYVFPDWLCRLARELAGISDDIVEVLPHFPACVVDDDEVFEAIRELARTIEEEADALEKQSAAAHAFSLVLTRHASIVPETSGDEREAVKQAKAMLEENLSESISLDDLAQRCSLSRYHLLREFKRTTGLPPHAWRMQARIHLGRRLLAKGIPIAEVALMTGFNDQSHFTFVFKKMVGTTPGTYQHG